MLKEIILPKVVSLYQENLTEIDFKELVRFITQTFGKIKVEVVYLREALVTTKGILYDPLNTHKAFKKITKEKSVCGIVFTKHLIATQEEFSRLHLHAAIFSEPCVISLSGIVEAPAKPKEYYLYKGKFESLGIWELKKDWLKKRFKGKFIDYQDRRMTEVLKGYISQALFFYMLGKPFCKLRSCRLYDSHWQKDLIFSQIRKGCFCPQHRKVLKQIKQ